MNQNTLKFLGIGLGVIVIGILAYFLFFPSDSSNKENGPKDSESSFQEEIQKRTNVLNPFSDTFTVFDSSKPNSYAEFEEDLETGKLNFVWELWALRRNCPANYTPILCDESILAFFDANYENPDKDNFKNMFEKYFEYEREMRKTSFQNPSKFSEYYETTVKTRKQILGEKLSKLLFGMEEAQVEFSETSNQFIKNSANMPPNERVKKYEQLKKETYGQYYQNIVSREDKYQNYQTELDLREKELDKLPPAQASEKRKELQIKYFGKDAEARIAKWESEEQERAKKLDEYKEKESQFLKQNPNLSEKEKQEKLQVLRNDTLGKEEGEAYTRRKNLEGFKE